MFLLATLLHVFMAVDARGESAASQLTTATPLWIRRLNKDVHKRTLALFTAVALSTLRAPYCFSFLKFVWEGRWDFVRGLLRLPPRLWPFWIEYDHAEHAGSSPVWEMPRCPFPRRGQSPDVRRPTEAGHVPSPPTRPRRPPGATLGIGKPLIHVGTETGCSSVDRPAGGTDGVQGGHNSCGFHPGTAWTAFHARRQRGEGRSLCFPIREPRVPAFPRCPRDASAAPWSPNAGRTDPVCGFPAGRPPARVSVPAPPGLPPPGPAGQHVKHTENHFLGFPPRAASLLRGWEQQSRENSGNPWTTAPPCWAWTGLRRLDGLVCTLNGAEVPGEPSSRLCSGAWNRRRPALPQSPGLAETAREIRLAAVPTRPQSSAPVTGACLVLRDAGCRAISLMETQGPACHEHMCDLSRSKASPPSGCAQPEPACV